MTRASWPNRARRAIPRPRAALVAIATAAVLALGTGAGVAGAAKDGGGATRKVETVVGPVRVPRHPERVVALDEYAAMNLLILGVRPVKVLGSYQSDVGARILRRAGIEVEPSAFAATFDVEQIAAWKPDLIVFSAEGDVQGNARTLARVAPTVVLPYEAPWREIVGTTAAVTGRKARAARVVDATEDRIAALRASLGRPAPSVAILATTPGFGTFSMSETAPVSQLLEEIGVSRPAAELGPPDMGSAIMTSEERIGDHEADYVIVLDGSYYDAGAITGLPTYQGLRAVRAGDAHIVDGDMWLGSFPFATYWVVTDLDGIFAGEGDTAVGSLDDLDARWRAFRRSLR